MDEQTMRGWLNDLQDRFDTLWLNDLQDRFDTLFKTLVQQRAAIFQQQSDALKALLVTKIIRPLILLLVEAVLTSMAATYEEHGYQESVSGSRIYESAALKSKLNSLQLQVINDDLGVITSQGGLSYHMQTSEKELAVLKFPLDQESMFRRQEGMLRRQEQQQLAKDAKIKRRL
ncbi:hypothetical protein Tco_1175411 [Tanacetum coccineum]